MDAYDEDSGARRGRGAFEPLEPPRPPGPPESDESAGSVTSSKSAESSAASEPSASHEVHDTGETRGSHEVPEPRRAGRRAESHPDSGDPTRPPEATGPSRDAPEPSRSAFPADPAPRTGVAALSRRYQVAAALALAVVAVGACVHLLMVFLSLAPANTVTKQHGKAVEEWIYPEFEQNWKLFAPNPLQQNIAVQVRAEVRMKDGSVRTTGWTDLSAQDGDAIKGNPVPSHTQQNELRRAWDFYGATHGADNRPVGLRGALSEQYVRRIVVMRLYRDDPTSKEGVIRRVQVRSSTTNVQPPKWSRERVSDKPVYRLLPWWSVTADEAAGGVR
ncbi:DUF5819 family protein [Streptomyces sp. NPDC096012]|uniref:DUF5819 family protein n=1 Tax=Streptomyces sp. NPDC096012 TaxID=3155684 RepID=UPI003369D806